MVNISEKDILYRPNLKPDRDYSSEAEILKTQAEENYEQVEETSSDRIESEIDAVINKADQLNNLLNINTNVFKNIKDNLTYISKNLSKIKGLETNEDLDNKSIDTDKEERVMSDKSKAFLTAVYGRLPDPVLIIGEQDVTKYIESSKNIDLLKVYKHYVDSMNEVFGEFYREALELFSKSNFSSVEEMLQDVEIITKDIADSQIDIEPIIHKLHMIKIMKDQKQKMLGKLFNIDKTVKNIMTIDTTSELRKKYYSIRPVV